MADPRFVPGLLEGAALARHHNIWDKKIANVEKYTADNAYNLMSDLVWNKRAGPIDDEYKDDVITQIYKYDSRIDVGEMWKIKEVQVVGRERRRLKMIKKKEEAVKHRTFQIVRNKTKIRQTKQRIAKEEAKLRMSKDETMERNIATSTLKPLRKAETRVDSMKSIFSHMDKQKELPIEIRRKVAKVNPTYGSVSPTRRRNPKKTFFGTSTAPVSHSDDFEHAENLSPRERHIKNSAVIKIQSIFRGRKARTWLNNQDQRNFPLKAEVSKNFLSGGNRGKAIFLEKKRQLLLLSKKRLEETNNDWEKEKAGLVAKVAGDLKTASLVKKRLKENKIQRRLDAEALMLHKNLRFIAACIIQNFAKNIVLEKYPHLVPILQKKRDKETTENKIALSRNKSRIEAIRRREVRKRRAVGRFNVIPVILRMQRTWREYLAIKHSKSEIGKAYALLKKMREDRISGREFFERLKKAHREEIGLAVDFNLKKRQKYIDVAWKGWKDYTGNRLRRKALLYQRVLRRKVLILEQWYYEILEYKVNLINSVRPNLFPPLLSEYYRFMRDNDWQRLLGTMSELFSDFDPTSEVRTLKYEEHTTNKVIGWKSHTELNEMLTWQIANSGMRKKPFIKLGKEQSLTVMWVRWMHNCSLFLWTKAREAAEENRLLTQQEEIGMLQGCLLEFLMKRNLNPASFSAKFRIKVPKYLRWWSKQELCTHCLSVLSKTSSLCPKCKSHQKSRFMRDTAATTHTNVPADGVLKQPQNYFTETLRNDRMKDKNDVKGVQDFNDALDLFVYHCNLSSLAPIGGWRRMKVEMEEMWSQAVRGASRAIHGLKRKGILTVADLWAQRIPKSGPGAQTSGWLPNTFEEVDSKLAEKCWELLGLLSDVLFDALGEANVNEAASPSGLGSGSIDGSSWRKLSRLETGSSIKSKNRARHDMVLLQQGERVPMGQSWDGFRDLNKSFRPMTR
ncbi:hypothetical protein TL16_g09682 [Triparma laevis f. inornata]|uniref:Uncharacterized protein n=1 Tax=Triparma laevis f. inornata TaxID=1714386 RepID=A0A9W7BBX2_9STRA|nr:hypothetical protein TL16_g09682 [Triparma laevis f. inornata]